MTVNVHPASLWSGQPLGQFPGSPDASSDRPRQRAVPDLMDLVRLRGDAGRHAIAAAPGPTLLLTRGRLAQGSLHLAGAPRLFTLAPGQVLLVPPSTAAELRLDHEHDLLVLSIAPAAIEALPSDPPTFDLAVLGLDPRPSPLLAALCESLWQDEGDEAFDRSRVATILHELARLSHAPSRRATGGLAPWALRRVMAHLDASLAEPLTLDELAGVARLSTYHFARAFKASTGIPPHRWIQMRRIERAKELLARRGMRVIDVAAAVGYENPSRFAKLFRRETGISPRCFSRRAEPADA